MSTQTTELRLLKTVLVYSTVGNNRKEVSTSAESWSELKAELNRQGVNVEGMKAVVGQTQVTLESPDAQVPGENFTLFLYPDKVKSGNFFEDDDDDFEDDYSEIEEAEDDYTQNDAVEDLTEARDRLTKVISYLSNPNFKLETATPVILDEATKALDEEARQIAAKMGIRG